MCGIIGVFGNPNAAKLAAIGMFAEQHRGQESCGMAVSDGHVIRLHKRMGLVKEVFTEQVLARLQGSIAIGHVRYPTTGSATEFNSQPHLLETLFGPSHALASNGDVVNYKSMRQKLEAEGVFFNSDNDAELLLRYIAWQMHRNEFSITEAIRMMMKDVKGAYSAVFMVRDALYMFRDPLNMRPMVWGKMEDGTTVVASESCALTTLGIHEFKEVPAAGIIRVNKQGITIVENDPNLYRPTREVRHCVFEHVYFSRPDSHHFDENVYEVRQAIGAKLAAQDEGLEVDLVVPVPDSSNFIGQGYANYKGLPLALGLIRNHYVGRSFIKPSQRYRDESVRQKYNVLPNFFKGKRVVLVDDSIVRGTTIGKIVKLLREAGASEVHLRIGSPQVKHGCYFGIDTPDESALVANRLSIQEITQASSADSLKHISIAELRECVHLPDHYCYACFDGQYPLEVES